MPFESPLTALRQRQLPDIITLAETASVDFPSGTLGLGQFQFDGSTVIDGSNLTFTATASVTGAVVGSVQLYNVTDGEIVDTLNFNTPTPTQQTSTLTIGAGAGEVKLTPTVYEVRISVTGTGPTDILAVGSVLLRISAP